MLKPKSIPSQTETIFVCIVGINPHLFFQISMSQFFNDNHMDRDARREHTGNSEITEDIVSSSNICGNSNFFQKSGDQIGLHDLLDMSFLGSQNDSTVSTVNDRNLSFPSGDPDNQPSHLLML